MLQRCRSRRRKNSLDFPVYLFSIGMKVIITYSTTMVVVVIVLYCVLACARVCKLYANMIHVYANSPCNQLIHLPLHLSSDLFTDFCNFIDPYSTRYPHTNPVFFPIIFISASACHRYSIRIVCYFEIRD